MSARLNFPRYRIKNSAYVGLYTPLYAPRHGSMPYAEIEFEPIRVEYCGPTAIAAITGCDLDSVRAAIYHFRREARDVKRDGSDKPIVGMNINEISCVMEMLGWRLVENKMFPVRPHLKSFARDFKNQGPFIVGVDNHVVAISHGGFCDTQTVTPISLSRALKIDRVREYKVHYWYRYEPIKITKRRKAINIERRAA